MKLKAFAVTVTTVTVLGVGVLAATTGRLPVPGLKPRSSSSDMAKPRVLKTPNTDDKAVVVIQVCWIPAEQGQQITVPWKLGSVQQYDMAGTPLNCQTPWARSATLARGDVVQVGWVLNSGVVSKFKARVTVNNRQAMDTTDSQNRMKLECVLGTPPCGF